MVVRRMLCGEVHAVKCPFVVPRGCRSENLRAKLFLRAVVGMVEVKPGFELVAYIVVLFVRGAFSAVFQVKIVIVLAA